jgi:hypothetical protein
MLLSEPHWVSSFYIDWHMITLIIQQSIGLGFQNAGVILPLSVELRQKLIIQALYAHGGT